MARKGRTDAVREQAPDPPGLGPSDLARKRDDLDRRLDLGFAKIALAEDDGTDHSTIAAWEEFWVSLLREYEQVCDDLREMQR